jgi:outer membrane protein insertion porin family
VSDETIIIYGKIELNKNYTESDLNIMLKDLYSTEFFSDIKIDIKNKELNININEYPYINQ